MDIFEDCCTSHPRQTWPWRVYFKKKDVRQDVDDDDDNNANMSDRKAVIKNADMSEEMQQDAVDCATQAMEKYNIEKDIAAFIKREFDKKYNPTWHAIVGRKWYACYNIN